MKITKHIGFLAVSGVILASVGMNLRFVKTTHEFRSSLEEQRLKTDSLLAVKLISDKLLDKSNKFSKSQAIEQKALITEIENLKSELNASEKRILQLIKNGDKTIQIHNNQENTESPIFENTEVLYASIQDHKTEISLLNQEIKYYESLKNNAVSLNPISIQYIPYREHGSVNTPLNSVKRSNALDIRFNILANPLAIPGNRNVFYVLSDSKGKIYRGSAREGYATPIITSSMTVEYNLKDTEVHTIISFDRKFKKDIYQLDIYIDGQMGGRASLDLK